MTHIVLDAVKPFWCGAARVASRAPWLCIAILVSVAVGGPVYSQETVQEEPLVSALKSNLKEVHFPDLSTLEKSVRDQLEILQNSLGRAARDPRTSYAQLSEAYGNMAEGFHAYSFAAPARECYLNAIALAPKNFRWRYLLARLEHQEGRADEAISGYLRSRTLRTDYLALSANLGNLYFELHRLEDARASFLDALNLDEGNAAAHYGLGQVALSHREYAESVKHFEKALQGAPAANRIHYSLAMAYRGLGDMAKAKTHFAKQGSVGVRVADPYFDHFQELIGGERVHLVRGRLALEAKRYGDAAIEFRKAVEANPASVPAHVNLGATLSQIGDIRGALEHFQEAIRIDPGTISARYNISILLSAEGKHEEAVTHLRVVTSASPGDAGARFLLAGELAKSGRVEEALSELSLLVRSDPDNEVALLELANLLSAKGLYQRALEALEQGHARYPKKPRTTIALAHLLAASPLQSLRDGARALRLSRSVYETSGSLSDGAIVALALAELGRCQEAADWQRALIIKAEKERNTTLVTRLRRDLPNYENLKSCRPNAAVLQ